VPTSSQHNVFMSYLVSSITSMSAGAACGGGFGFSLTISSASRSPFVELSTYSKMTAHFTDEKTHDKTT